RLLRREELNVQELVRVLGAGQPQVSRHLALLREAGWIRQRRAGTWSWYAAVAAADFTGGAGLHGGVLAAAETLPGVAADDAALAIVLRDRDARAGRFFAGAARRWDDIRREFESSELHLAAVAALVPPGLRVVDVGTGTGALLPLLAAAGCRVIAIDSSAAMLEQAREACARERLTEITFQRADVQALPLRDGVCDAAFAALVLRHVARPAAALAELARVVRPGGRVVLLDFTRHEQAWMREELAHQWLGFARDELERLLRQAGLAPLAYATRAAAPPAGGRRRRDGGGWPDLFLAVAARPDTADTPADPNA
ncbi:MAG: ArsR/SmtB family transcription factor, partial [Candidatus Krumholzibacteriia bacterium]